MSIPIELLQLCRWFVIYSAVLIGGMSTFITVKYGRLIRKTPSPERLQPIHVSAMSLGVTILSGGTAWLVSDRLYSSVPGHPALFPIVTGFLLIIVGLIALHMFLRSRGPRVTERGEKLLDRARADDAKHRIWDDVQAGLKRRPQNEREGDNPTEDPVNSG